MIPSTAMNDPHALLSIELVKVSPTGARRVCQLSVDGVTLTSASGAAGKPLKTTAKTFSDAQTARVAYEKSCRAKFREGFAFVRDFASTQPGDVVLRTFASGAGAGVLLDLSPDGTRVVTVGSNSELTEYWVETIDVATGQRRTVYEASTGKNQCFVHAVLFDATGETVYLAVQEETLRLDLTRGATTHIASYLEGTNAQFNPHVLRPQFDRARQRLVVFDAGSRVRVIDPSAQTIFEVCTASPTSECRAAAISPSGKLLALHHISRGLVYQHNDALHDQTNVVEIWEIDTGVLRTSVPFTKKLDAVGFEPFDQRLIVAWEYAQGPVAYDLATGAECWRFEDPWSNERLAVTYGWAYSPDGSLLAVGRHRLVLYDAVTRSEMRIAESRGYKIAQVRFSADGSRLAVSEDGTCVVRRVR
jgi:WD40 repeat protein